MAAKEESERNMMLQQQRQSVMRQRSVIQDPIRSVIASNPSVPIRTNNVPKSAITHSNIVDQSSTKPSAYQNPVPTNIGKPLPTVSPVNNSMSVISNSAYQRSLDIPGYHQQQASQRNVKARTMSESAAGSSHVGTPSVLERKVSQGKELVHLLQLRGGQQASLTGGRTSNTSRDPLHMECNNNC